MRPIPPMPLSRPRSRGLLAGLCLLAILAGPGCALTGPPPGSPAAPSATPASAWVLPRAASPESVGLSSAQLARVAEVTSAHVASGAVPGAVMLVARRGQIAWLHTTGWRDRDRALPMRDDAIFRLYSMTKPIVSVAVMMLVEEGRLQITDPISQHLPEMRGMKLGVERVDAAGRAVVERSEPPREMTVQDLLRHTTGLTYAGRSSGAVADEIRAAGLGARNESNRQFVEKLARTPLVHAPGTRWEYGVSTDVLGRLVEVISGQSLGEFLRVRIFEPLGMTDTAFWVPADRLDRAAQPWQRPGGPPMTPRFDVATRPAFESGGGGLVGTASDYLRFATMLLNGGELNGRRLIGAQTLAFMTADHVGALPGRPPGLGFGLGFEVRTSVGRAGLPGSVGEYGWAGNAGTLFWVDPAEQLIALYLVQVNDGERIALRNQFRTMTQAAITRKP